MIEHHWPRIAGLHCQADGGIAAVWLAHDKDADCVHLYDSCLFRREVLAVVADGIKARGGWIPIAWANGGKDIVERLLERGLNTLTEPAKDSPALAEAASMEIWERMRSGRFKAARQLTEWLDEFQAFGRREGQVPLDGYPLMSATRHAASMLSWAMRKADRGRRNYPETAIV